MNSNGPGQAFDGRSTARTSRERWLVVLGGVLAGLVAFGTGEATYQTFRPALVRQNLMGNKLMTPTLKTNHAAAVKNGALAFGVLGGCLGVCLGAAGGLARGPRGRPSWRTPRRGAGIGPGAGLSLALLPWFLEARFDYLEYDLIISLVMHGLIWGLLGASAGLAFAIGMGERRLLGRALIAGCLGGLLGAIIFELVGAMYFTAAETGNPISLTWPTRLMARLFVTLGTAAAIVLFLPNPPADVVGRQSELVVTPPET